MGKGKGGEGDGAGGGGGRGRGQWDEVRGDRRRNQESMSGLCLHQVSLGSTSGIHVSSLCQGHVMGMGGGKVEGSNDGLKRACFFSIHVIKV